VQTIEHRFASAPSIADPRGLLVDGFGIPIALPEIRHCVREIARRHQRPFFVDVRSNLVGFTELGVILRRCIDADFAGIDRAYPDHRLCPTYGLFVEWVAELQRVCPCLTPATVNTALQHVLVLRRRARSPRFQKRMESHLGKFWLDVTGLSSLLRRLLKRQSTLLGVRVELAYPAAAAPNEPGDVKSAEPSPSVAEAKKCLSLMLKRFQLKHAECEWMTWRIRFNSQKSIHFDMLLLFAGRDQKDGIMLGQTINELWGEVTSGTGSFVSLNENETSSNSLRSLGVGYFEYNHFMHRDDLVAAAHSFAGANSYLQLIGPGVGKSYFRSDDTSRRSRESMSSYEKLVRESGLLFPTEVLRSRKRR
jgi:hypothetical protein